MLKYFSSIGHSGFLKNISLALTDKTDGKNPKKTEDYWQRALKTYTPFGFKVEDIV